MPGTQYRPDGGPARPTRSVPVAVVSRTDAEGRVTPLSIEWPDGRSWRVEVDFAEPWGARPAQGCGTQRWRYRVRLLPSGQRRMLYWDVPGWHVDVGAPREQPGPEVRGEQQEWWPEGWA